MTTTPTAPAQGAPRPGMDGLGEGMRPQDETGTRSAFRTDIQGLRAVAVLLVVLYHCGVGLFGGGYVGVDVFFVISGFLITGHLVAEVERTGRVSLTRFWARRIRRLLPPALIVIASTVVVARLWGPVLDSSRSAVDALFAAFYAMNYRLADQGVDYAQANATPSPFQHFWSLAVEEQFYLAWPVLVLVIALLARRAGRTQRRVLLGLLVAVISAASLYASVEVTSSNPPLAYFSLHTRAWELGVGALLALAVPALRRAPVLAARWATWAGLGMVLAAAVLFDDATPFPGTAALLPVLGAGLVLAGGTSAPAGGVDRVLRHRPTQLVGDVSYAWYLWHWPFLVLGPAIFARELSVVENLELCALALWLAVLTNLVLERPVLRQPLQVRRWFGIGAALSLVVVCTSGAALLAKPQVQGDGAGGLALAVTDVPSLQSQLVDALSTDSVPAGLTPALDEAAADVPQTSLDGCHITFLQTEQPACVYGDAEADKTMLLFGDSHAEQWFGALEQIAEQEGYRLVSWTKVACPLSDTTIVNGELGRDYTECDQWRTERLAAISDLQPDVIVASQADTLVPYSFSDDEWAAGTRRTLQALAGDTTDLVFLSDIPRAVSDVPSCLAARLDDLTGCDIPSDLGLQAGLGSDFAHLPGRHQATQSAVSDLPMTNINTQPWFCIGEECPPVVGSTLVYRDDSHMTQTYARAIAPLLRNVIDTSTATTTTTGDPT